MYDVIVIGAGPTGATAAKILAEKGLSVLLVEKFKLPRYKSCSGILIQKSLNLVEKYFGKSVPESVTCAPADNKGMVITTDSGVELKFETTGLNVWRSSFDNFLTEEAVNSGAQICDETTVSDCESKVDCVTVVLHGKDGYKVEKAKYMIDCEGVVGALKRRIIGKEPQYITTYQTFNKGIINLDYHYFYAYLQTELSEYDAWFNVKDGMLVLGVASENPKSVQGYYGEFIAYMTQNHSLRIDERLREDKWIIRKIKEYLHTA